MRWRAHGRRPGPSRPPGSPPATTGAATATCPLLPDPSSGFCRYATQSFHRDCAVEDEQLTGTCAVMSRANAEVPSGTGMAAACPQTAFSDSRVVPSHRLSVNFYQPEQRERGFTSAVIRPGHATRRRLSAVTVRRGGAEPFAVAPARVAAAALARSVASPLRPPPPVGSDSSSLPGSRTRSVHSKSNQPVRP